MKVQVRYTSCPDLTPVCIKDYRVYSLFKTWLELGYSVVYGGLSRCCLKSA